MQQELGQFLAFTVAAVTTITVLTRFGPIRWVWRRLVHEPVKEGLTDVIHREVKPILEAMIAEMQPNHGTSLRDAIDRLEYGQKETLKLIDDVRTAADAGVLEAKATAAAVRHDLEASILAGQGRLPNG